MKITISQIIERIKSAQDTTERTKREQEKADNESRKLYREAEEAAAAGDVDTYLRLKQELDRQEAIAYVLKTQLERQSTLVTEEEIKAAWGSYASEYEKNLAAARADYEKSKAATISAFRKMVDLQHDALSQREKLADFAGIPAKEIQHASPAVENAFPMTYIFDSKQDWFEGIFFKIGNSGPLFPDLAFYISNLGHTKVRALMNDKEVNGIIRENNSHLPS